jgi:uroporphyrin-III C-methyltransferase/precorrin-2 dehydrogenase/sirohydrochlorin ferrochelatase
MSARTALLLAGHGYRHDQIAAEVLHGHADAVRQLRQFDEVLVTMHHGTPTFADALGATSATQITVVPCFTSAGWFSETVLPRELLRHPRSAEVTLDFTPPLGTHPRIAPMLVARVETLLAEHRLVGTDVTVLIAGHGTTRHARSRTAAFALADAIRAARLVRAVDTAFIDDDPALDTVLDHVRTGTVLVLPFFIGGGGHARVDVPTALGLAPDASADPFAPRMGVVEHRQLLIDRPLGALPGMALLIAELALGALARRRGTPALMLPVRPSGRVTLVGAGPGDPELITVKGLRALQHADVIVHDRLGCAALLAEARSGARLIDVGKAPGSAPVPQAAIDALLVEEATRGHDVVRLKGGDPFVFGRGSEEVAACRAAGIEVAVIPGISSALAGPAAAGIAVTARGVARSFTVMTGHQLDDAPGTVPLSPTDADTLVVLMGRSTLPQLVAQLLAAGRPASTPVACIENATLPQQRVIRGTLGDIVTVIVRAELGTPMVAVIGDVARQAESDLAALTSQVCGSEEVRAA